MAERTPAAWLELLERRLDERWARLRVFDAYYEGDQRIAYATRQWNEAFGGQFGLVVDNWCEIAVDAAAERLRVTGFRVGDSQEADSDAWDIWQANNLDAQASMLHTEAIKLSEAYWLVEPPAEEGGFPRITCEHPSQVVVAHAPGNPRVRLAALKRWVGDDGHAYANVFLPRHVVKYFTKKPLASGGVQGGRHDWVQYETVPNALGAVPAVPVRNNPSMLRGGRSDLEVAIPIQDALNKELADMLIGSEYMAYPQRVLLGVTPPKDENGRPLRSAELTASKSRLWTFSDPNAKIAEFTAADLQNFVAVRESLLGGFTAKTRIPPHYVGGDFSNASADFLQKAEVGLAKKCTNKLPDMGDSHEEMMRLAFLARGDRERAREVRVETIWADVETRSFGELVDGLMKLSAIGVPNEVLWERAGFTPTEIDRMRSMQAEDVFLGVGDSGDEPPVVADN